METAPLYMAEATRPRLTVVKDDGASYSALPHDLLRDSRTKHGHIVTYAVLQMHWWQGGECWASHATLATEAKCSERQLQRYLHDLVAWKFITERRRGHGQARAYAPADSPSQHDTGVVLNPTSMSPSMPNTTPVSDQHDTGVAFNTTPVSYRRRSTEEDSLKEEETGGSVAADAAPASPAVVKTPKKSRRSTTPKADETTAPDAIPLTDQSYETAAKWGYSREAVDFELERFLSKARAKGWTYVDWKQGFRTWLMNEVQYAKRDGRPVGAVPARNGSGMVPPGAASKQKSDWSGFKGRYGSNLNPVGKTDGR